MTTRLTRKEQQARTRAALLESAGAVLGEKGLHRASIDDITAHAGFTKGAFYANFGSKQELLLVMLDEHFAQRLEAIDALLAGSGDLSEQAARAGQDFIEALRGDRLWARLFLEFTSHAARDEAFRRAFAQRADDLRASIAEIYARRVAEAGLTPSVEPALVARMVFAMARGAVIEDLLDPESPDDLLAQMLQLAFDGLVAGAAG